ncbi:hypothetical protein Hanom_Chr01g00043481 [Helianthus anomalus]
MLFKGSFLPLQPLRTLMCSLYQLFRFSPQASVFLLLASKRLVVFHNSIRHYGTPHKHRGELVEPSSRGKARARLTSNGVPRPPRISLQAEGLVEMSSPCIMLQGDDDN